MGLKFIEAFDLNMFIGKLLTTSNDWFDEFFTELKLRNQNKVEIKKSKYRLVGMRKTITSYDELPKTLLVKSYKEILFSIFTQ